MTQGEIVSIHWVAEDRGPAQSVDEIEIKADWGLAGDFRSKPDSERQVTMVSEEAIADVQRKLERPIAAGATRRQIVVRGLDLNDMIGRTLRIGSVELRGELPCHGCERMDETLGVGGQEALKGQAGLCCSVTHSGTVHAGDPISVSDEKSG